MDSKKRFIGQLRKVAEMFTPYVTNYEGLNDKRVFIPLAQVWRSNLRTIASLLEFQESPVSKAQIDYLDRNIFGTMGSLTDFSFGIDELGKEAEKMNRKLDEERGKLYKTFVELGK